MITSYYIGLDVHKDSISMDELAQYVGSSNPHLPPAEVHPREPVPRHRENPSIRAEKQGESRKLPNARSLQEERSH